MFFCFFVYNYQMHADGTESLLMTFEHTPCICIMHNNAIGIVTSHHKTAAETVDVKYWSQCFFQQQASDPADRLGCYWREKGGQPGR